MVGGSLARGGLCSSAQVGDQPKFELEYGQGSPGKLLLGKPCRSFAPIRLFRASAKNFRLACDSTISLLPRHNGSFKSSANGLRHRATCYRHTIEFVSIDIGLHLEDREQQPVKCVNTCTENTWHMQTRP